MSLKYGELPGTSLTGMEESDDIKRAEFIIWINSCLGMFSSAETDKEKNIKNVKSKANNTFFI